MNEINICSVLAVLGWDVEREIGVGLLTHHHVVTVEAFRLHDTRHDEGGSW